MASVEEPTSAAISPLQGMLDFVNISKSKLMDAKIRGVTGFFHTHELQAVDLLCKMMIDIQSHPHPKLLYRPVSSPSSWLAVKGSLQSIINKGLAKSTIDDEDINLVLRIFEDAIPFLSLKFEESYSYS
ncbi:hypothetical protein OCU04_011588 [Sclerotinia nivalis]|uniref:Uncharacterized protein n=1 Tax=Sclerotinia nivalis TaxID=352851 RepID=A0A9X0DEL4_9HELO|nr:hypothetical protein OCU04_011588 [Sclerotinia nivalis]